MTFDLASRIKATLQVMKSSNKKGTLMNIWESDVLAIEDALAAIESMKTPVPPTAVHWLGDRESSDETRHAVDVRGCVLYFQQQSQCADFIEWLGDLCTCGGDIGQPVDHHDISCPVSITSENREGEA